MTMKSEVRFLTTKELASRWRLSHRTLEGWRDKGIGPKCITIGARVLYAVEHIEEVERRGSFVGEGAKQ